MQIIIRHKPMPTPRVRVTRWGAYNNPKYTTYKETIKNSVKVDKVLTGALKMEMVFQIKIPKSWTKKKRSDYKNIIPVGDCDNYAKGVMDALQKHLFEDDRQVVDLRISKRYGLTDLIIVRINEVNFDTIKEIQK